MRSRGRCSDFAWADFPVSGFLPGFSEPLSLFPPRALAGPPSPSPSVLTPSSYSFILTPSVFPNLHREDLLKVPPVSCRPQNPKVCQRKRARCEQAGQELRQRRRGPWYSPRLLRGRKGGAPTPSPDSTGKLRRRRPRKVRAKAEGQGTPQSSGLNLGLSSQSASMGGASVAERRRSQECAHLQILDFLFFAPLS